MKKRIIAMIAIILSVVTLATAVTPAFAAAPASATDTTPWSNFPVQKRYDYNEYYTRAIQTVLYYLNGTYKSILGSIDGKFGPSTENAVATFQTANGLNNDGKVGPLTWAALYDCLVKETQPPYPIVPNSLYVVPNYYKVSGYVLFMNKPNNSNWYVRTDLDKLTDLNVLPDWQQFNPEQ